MHDELIYAGMIIKPSCYVFYKVHKEKNQPQNPLQCSEKELMHEFKQK
jgi:hypothetical protein